MAIMGELSLVLPEVYTSCRARCRWGLCGRSPRKWGHEFGRVRRFGVKIAVCLRAE